MQVALVKLAESSKLMFGCSCAAVLYCGSAIVPLANAGTRFG